jgi:hypothetical protein
MISQRNRLIFIWKNIHYFPYLLSHFFFMLLKVLAFNKVYITAIKQAYTLLPQIREKRTIEKKEARVSDKELFEAFGRYQKQFK